MYRKYDKMFEMKIWRDEISIYCGICHYSAVEQRIVYHELLRKMDSCINKACTHRA